MSGTPGRLLTLLSLLQARRDWPGQLLADRLEVSARTVRRDVDRLRELGYPIRAAKGPDGGYRLDAGADLPPLLFDDDQAVALAVALQQTAAAGGGVGEAAARALVTVRQVMPSRLRQRVDVLSTAESVPTRGAGTGVEPGVLLAVGQAVRAREQLRFDHAGATGDAPRRVEPHHLLTRSGRWYLLAWDLDRDDWRTFRVDRMRPRVPTGPRFTPREVPGGDAPAFVSARFKGSDREDVWPCRGEVVLRASLQRIAPFAGDGTVEAADGFGDDHCRVSRGAWSWRGLAAVFAAPDAEIVEARPQELRVAFAELAGRFGRIGNDEGPVRGDRTGPSDG